jgi:fatty-acyl-CoA synthase
MASTLRTELRQQLETSASRVLWRIVTSGRMVELTGAGILARAEELARQYCAAPERGVVLLLLPHSEELFLLHIGLILRNRVPAILAWPTNRIDPEKYQRNLLHQLRNLPACQVITLRRLAGYLAPALPYSATACEVENSEQFEKAFLPVDIELLDKRERHPESAPEDAVFLQFTGGTTGAQKSVVVTAPMLRHQMQRLAEALAFTAEDTVISWLPMYHDMGLIGCLWFPLWQGASSLHFSATDWLLNPELLFRYIEEFRGTFCWLPNFAFSYLAAQRERMNGNYRLQQVRAWISCSEPVRRASMNGFLASFAGWGVKAEALQASYAMAENVFAVTQTVLGEPLPTLPRGAIRHCATSDSQLAFDMIDAVYVSSGKILRGTEIRIMDNGVESGNRQPGEIWIRSQSLFGGYWGNAGFLGNSLSADGWYSTGDYGFLAEGDLYVIGRMKDIVIVGGQNVFPEDVESVVNTVEGIYPGRAVAFGVDDEEYGTQALAIVAELRGPYDQAEAKRLQRAIQKLVLSTMGIAPRYVSVMPERWIVKSTAGKISRGETRARFQLERENLVAAPVAVNP